MIIGWIASYRKKRSERKIKRLNALWSGWLDDVSGVNDVFKTETDTYRKQVEFFNITNVHSDNSNKKDSRPS